MIKGVAGDPALGVGPLPKCLYPFPVAQRLKTSEVVFSGRVIDIKKDGEQEEISFKVFKSWKNVHSSEVKLTNYPEGEAAAQYKLGESYLVFANGSQEKPTTGACAHVPVMRFARNEINELNRLSVRSKHRS